MRQELLSRLSEITEEEKKIQAGAGEIEKSLYAKAGGFVVEKDKLLSEGRLIRLRTHTRFLPFPAHRHDYVEMVYQAAGETRHRINGDSLTLREGELLIMNQHAEQSIEAAELSDIAVNFIILPQFFDRSIELLGNEKSPLRDFLVSCLGSGEAPVSYLHFQVAGILPIENLTENLIASLLSGEDDALTEEVTMALLFRHLLSHTERLSAGKSGFEQTLIFRLLQYIDLNYREGSLTGFAAENHLELTSLSRLVKKYTGSTYQELLQQKRLQRAAELLTGSSLSVSDIAMAVGYENISFFHRLFRKTYGTTPRRYRVRDGISSK